MASWIAIAVVVLGSLAVMPTVRAEDTIRDLGTLPGDTHSGAVKMNEAGQVVGWSGQDAGYGRLHAFLWEDDVMTDLGTLGGTHAQAYDINEGGQIVGVSVNASNLYQPFLWEDGVMTQLDVGSNSAWGTAINDLGHIAGYRWVPDPEWGAVARAYLLQDGVITDLGPLPGLDNSFATSMNNAGQVVGYAQDSGIHPDVRAFLWDDGVM